MTHQSLVIPSSLARCVGSQSGRDFRFVITTQWDNPQRSCYIDFKATTFSEIAELQKKKRCTSKNSCFLHEIWLEKLQKYVEVWKNKLLQHKKSFFRLFSKEKLKIVRKFFSSSKINCPGTARAVVLEIWKNNCPGTARAVVFWRRKFFSKKADFGCRWGRKYKICPVGNVTNMIY